MKETKERGITLIALVITIIVLLILAGVAINLTIGDNGIFKKADEAAKVYQNASNKEATELNNLYGELTNLINKVNGETPGNPDDNGIFTENSTINGGEASAFNPEIPKGFKPVDEDTAIWGDGTSAPTEEAVKAGLIIEDGDYSRQGGTSINSSLANTGTNGDEVCHIQDMASNCQEWTTETCSDWDYYTTKREGRYYDWYGYTGNRDWGDSSDASNLYSFRPTLYL